MSGALVNDVHSRLNETLVDSVVPVDPLEPIGTAIEFDRSVGLPVAIAGGRHSLPTFLAAKLEHDPGELFQSDWYDWLRSTIELEAAA
jgi:hypothetical protein